MSLRTRGLGVAALLALAGGSLVGAAAPLGVPNASAAVHTIRILNINDFHGRIDSNTVNFATTVENLRAAAPDPNKVLFLAAGDLVGASLFASAVQNDNPTLDVMNTLMMNSSSVGNHEFDKGYNDLETHLRTRAQFPYLCANCYNAGTTTPAKAGAGGEYALHTVNGLTVGVIGAVTMETPSLVSPSGVSMLSFGDPVAAVNRVAQQLSNGNAADGEAQILIAEYHEGASVDDTPTLAEALQSPAFSNIANNTSHLVDAIFTGHTHEAYRFDAPVPAPGVGTRPILQSGEFGNNVAMVDLTFDDVANTVTTTSQIVPRTNTANLALPRVAQVKTIVDQALAFAAQEGNKPVGSVTANITTAHSGGAYTNGVYTGGNRDDRARESTLGNLVADALLWKLDDPQYGGAELAFANPGGLRAELLFAPDGVITVAEANSVLPFGNNLHTITLTGAQVKMLLEQQWQPAGAQRPFLALGASRNITWTFDPARPQGDRITSITINGAPYDPARNYRVGSFSFLVDGGDNFTVFQQGTNKQDTGLVDREAWFEFLGATSPVAPDFAKHGTQVVPLPPAQANPGTRLQFAVSNLDLTSLGSPANTHLDVLVGGRVIGTVAVTNGAANVDVVVPELPTAARSVSLVARPSGTVIFGRTITPIDPVRLIDTRGESPGAIRTQAKISGTTILQVKATDIPGRVPATGVAAVSLNVAVTNAEGNGFVTVYPCGTRQLVANVNYVTGETVSNAVLAPVSAEGNVCFFSLAPVDLVVDINGWLPDSGYNAITPTRIFDTRAGESPAALRTVPKQQISGDPALMVQVTNLGPGGAVVPGAGVGAVSLNVAVANSTRAGYLAVYPCGQRQLIANVNFTAGEIASNAVFVPVSATGNLCFYSPVPVDVIVDINGWFGAGSAFNGVTPARLMDSRPGESPNAAVVTPKVRLAADSIFELDVTGAVGVPPNGVGSVSLNVAVVNPESAGYITAYPCGTRPLVATVNYVGSQIVSNSVLAPVSPSGTVCFYTLKETDLVVDVNGWIAG